MRKNKLYCFNKKTRMSGGQEQWGKFKAYYTILFKYRTTNNLLKMEINSRYLDLISPSKTDEFYDQALKARRMLIEKYRKGSVFSMTQHYGNIATKFPLVQHLFV
jgi:hypothetical protein